VSRFIFILVILAIYFSIDLYAYIGLDGVFEGSLTYRSTYLFISLLVLGSFGKIFTDLQANFGVRNPLTNFLIGFAFAVFVTKLIFSILILGQDVSRLILAFTNGISALGDHAFLESAFPPRSWNITAISAILSAIPFLVMIYGITWGKYRYKVVEVDLPIQDLPASFIGFKIAQISDVHAGSFDSVKQVAKGIELLNDQKPDIILFTGDLVNSHKDEIDPYLDVFSNMYAPYGMYSVTGNHDYYGMYRYGIPSDKDSYWNDFEDKHRQIGFRLLNNETHKVKKGNGHIHIAGVENWGAGPFPKRGNLNLALRTIDDQAPVILMSHDPTHWPLHVLPHQRNIDLTLSGHTHAMQFGINLFGWVWSPVKYRYKHWMGLYEENGQKLYVNRGFGFLGFPGRVGMSPEITIFTLTKVNP
jgi:hypothetical protein